MPIPVARRAFSHVDEFRAEGHASRHACPQRSLGRSAPFPDRRTCGYANLLKERHSLAFAFERHSRDATFNSSCIACLIRCAAHGPVQPTFELLNCSVLLFGLRPYGCDPRGSAEQERSTQACLAQCLSHRCMFSVVQHSLTVECWLKRSRCIKHHSAHTFVFA